MVFVVCQGTLSLWTFSFGDFQFVAKTDGGEAKILVVAFDASLDLGFEIIGCGDSARFQRAGKSAGQSTGKRGNNVIHRGGKRRGVLYAVILSVAAMHSKMQRLREAFNVRVAEGPFFLNQTNPGGMNKFTHERLPSQEMPGKSKSYKQQRGRLFVVLN